MKSVQHGADETANQPRPPPALPVPLIPDHELLRRIGTGSYGEVWLARTLVGTLRAIKVVYRQTFEQEHQFDREFNGLQKFEPISRSHDGLVDILQLGRNDAAGYFYYVMELADDANTAVAADVRRLTSSLSQPTDQSLLTSAATYIPKTLRSEQRRLGRIPVNECLDIALALTDALAHLHAHGLVHRDIKPSNIIFVNGKPKLADIGLVADISEARSFVGTMGFIPPEGPGKAQADLYSLGKVLYEISTGKDRQEFPALPPNLRELSDADTLIEFNEIVLKACDDDARQRYASAEAMRADLARLQLGKSVIRKHSWQRFNVLATRIGLGTATLALLLAAGWKLSSHFSGSKLQRTNGASVISSLAVLPFDNEGADKADEYLGTQFAEELGGTLAKIPQLRVIGRNSAQALKASKNLRQAARQLNLGAVLDGRIQKANDRIRVSAQLIKTTDGFVLWSDTYEVESADLLGLQTRLAESVVQALHLKLTDSVRSRLAAKSTKNLEAYRLYLEGRYLWHKRSAAGLVKSIDLFQQAIRLDPNFARAYVGLADTYNILDDHGISPAKEAKPKAREAALKALALDDALPEAHASLAKVLMEFDWDWPGAEREYLLAIKMDPTYPTARQWYSQFLEATGRPKEALEQIEIGVQLDPLSCILLVNLGMRHYLAGRYDRAIECARRAREVDPNFGNNFFGRFYEQRGMYDQAVEEWERSIRYNGRDVEMIVPLKAAYAESGIRGFWRTWLNSLKDSSGQRFLPNIGFAAELHARLGETNLALDCLEKGVADRSTFVLHMHLEPRFENLRSHPRFLALLKQMGLEK